MKKAISSALAAAAVALLLAGCGGDEDKKTGKKDKDTAAKVDLSKIAQKTCPVMKGGKLDAKLFADHKGRRVYFCCEGCIGEFKKDPEKYIKIVDEEIAKDKAGGDDHAGHKH